MTQARRTYLDFNATAPLRPEARAALFAAVETFGNPSSVHAEGRAARALVEAARASVARLIGVRAAGLTFTSSATEALNTVIAAPWGRVIAVATEHAAVLAPASRTGAFESVRVDGCGVIDLGHLELLLAKSSDAVGGGRKVAGGTLVCVQAANNETGVVQPVDKVVSVCSAYGAFVLCDAVQAAGKIPFDAAEFGVDYAVVSAHKFGGPKGIGALWTAPGAGIPAFIVGGGQEQGLRGGTQNVPGIAAFGAAAEAATAELGALDMAPLKADFESKLKSVLPDCVIVGEGAERLPQTVCAAVPGCAAETLVIALDLQGYAVSSGAACSSGKVSKSHVLTAMGVGDTVAAGAVRISWGRATAASDLAKCAAALAACAERSRHIERVA